MAQSYMAQSLGKWALLTQQLHMDLLPDRHRAVCARVEVQRPPSRERERDCYDGGSACRTICCVHHPHVVWMEVSRPRSNSYHMKPARGVHRPTKWRLEPVQKWGVGQSPLSLSRSLLLSLAALCQIYLVRQGKARQRQRMYHTMCIRNTQTSQRDNYEWFEITQDARVQVLTNSMESVIGGQVFQPANQSDASRRYSSFSTYGL